MRLPAPVLEHSFHPVRRWKFDVAWPKIRIAIEVEGGIWKPGGGAHSRPANIMRDMEKYNAATMLGWRVLRFTPEQVVKQAGTIVLMVKELATNEDENGK